VHLVSMMWTVFVIWGAAQRVVLWINMALLTGVLCASVMHLFYSATKANVSLGVA